MQRTEKYFENDAFRKTAAGVILAAEADAKTGAARTGMPSMTCARSGWPLHRLQAATASTTANNA